MKVVTVREAAGLLREGLVVLVPTETVVGLVASEDGLSRIHEIKGRDPAKPIALLCDSPDEAWNLAVQVPPLARKLADLYWPGSLTLVLDSVRGGTIGVRVPDHTTVKELLTEYGGPLYATSANLAGEPSPTALEDVDERVKSAVDVIVEGEPGNGEASAVVDLSGGETRLLRPTRELTEQTLLRLKNEAQ